MTMPKIKPLGKRILVKREQQATTMGGIFLPDSAQEKPKQGEIVAVGPGKTDEEGKLHALEVVIGDKILFSSYAGVEVKPEENDENEYLIMSEDDVLAVIQ
ncbi:MAG: 10 kDa chaperonin [Chlamydiia bacterium]|nr:10 kDa chaperonin [Chlamydiia bacterium]